MAMPGHEQIRCVVADPPSPGPVGEGGSQLFVAPESAVAMDEREVFSDLDWRASLAEIHAVAPVTAPLAHLWMWAPPAQHIDWVWKTARAWGFEPVHLLTWARTGAGIGHFAANTEHILLARKGGPRRNAFGRMSGTHYSWPVPLVGRPDEFFHLIEKVSPGPYLDMFAHEGRPGWEAWALPPTTSLSSRVNSPAAHASFPTFANPDSPNVPASK